MKLWQTFVRACVIFCTFNVLYYWLLLSVDPIYSISIFLMFFWLSIVFYYHELMSLYSIHHGWDGKNAWPEHWKISDVPPGETASWGDAWCRYGETVSLERRGPSLLRICTANCLHMTTWQRMLTSMRDVSILLRIYVWRGCLDEALTIIR